ncbi:MAG: zinc-binding dehydrogenase [Candidatus Dormibacteria bacterium]|jgi:NADPH:quinone reductase-like Zn-dependent oxidoreductase
MLAAYAIGADSEEPLAKLQVGDLEMPQPPSGWVRLVVTAASLNHHDLWTLRGVGAPPSRYPRILGCDVAGRVDAYGPDTFETLPLGAAVIAHAVITCGRCRACLGADETLCRHFAMLTEGPFEGTLAQYCLVPARNILALPKGLSAAEAACLPTAYLTAYRMLFTKADLRPGDTVLIQGAGGGLSTAAECLALAAGLRVVVSSRSAAKRQAALDRGAHHVVATGREAVSEVLGLTDGEGVDAVIESVGEATWATSLRVLRRGGVVVVAGATAGSDPPADLRRVFWRQLRVMGSMMGTRSELSSLLSLVELSQLHPIIDSTFPLAQAEQAFARLASGSFTGKLVVSVA